MTYKALRERIKSLNIFLAPERGKLTSIVLGHRDYSTFATSFERETGAEFNGKLDGVYVRRASDWTDNSKATMEIDPF
jgi:hypothetical protein